MVSHVRARQQTTTMPCNCSTETRFQIDVYLESRSADHAQRTRTAAGGAVRCGAAAKRPRSLPPESLHLLKSPFHLCALVPPPQSLRPLHRWPWRFLGPSTMSAVLPRERVPLPVSHAIRIQCVYPAWMGVHVCALAPPCEMHHIVI